MSFSESLHDCFEMVHNHSIQRRKGATEFIQLMEEKALLEETYAKGLEKIGNNQYFVTTQGTLSHAILAMKNDSLNKAMQARILAENILTDLAEPLKELLRNQAKTLLKTNAEGKKSEKEHQSLREKHDKYKSRYMKACKEYEDLNFQLETPQILPRRDKIMQRLVQVKQEIDESLRGYKDSIIQYNEYKDKYTDFMSKILEVYQKQEEQRLETMKDCLRKLVVYETSYLRNLQYDIDNLARAMESINIKSDIKQFIDENASPNAKNTKLEFKPYQGIHESFKNLGTESPVVKIPPACVSAKFSEISNQSSIEEILKAELALITNKCWDNVKINSAEIQYFLSVVKENPGKKAFLHCLNTKKIEGRFCMNQSGYEDLGKLFNYFITECDKLHEVVTLKNLIDLSQLFYVENEGEKNSLKELIVYHPVWQKLEYWELMINLSINEEIKSHEIYAQPEESKEEKEKRFKNIVFCQLGSYGFLIESFGIDIKYTAEIVSKYACRYNLSTQDMETLMVKIYIGLNYKKKYPSS